MTRLPVDRWTYYDSTAMPRCIVYFPIVGGAIGLVAGLAYLLASSFPHSIAVLIAMLAPVLLTGALHEDGLADAADGLCGQAPRERALEIMRDSRIGAYGALALAFLLAFRYAAIDHLGSAWDVIRAMIAAAAMGRAAAVGLMSTCINLRNDSATSRPFGSGLPPGQLIFCLGATVAGAFVLLGFSLTPVIAGVTVALGIREYFLRRLGGITGDCLGAAVVVTELAVLVFAAAY